MPGALLEDIPGVVDGIDHHVSGAVERIEFANGVGSERFFDPRHRLVGIRTAPPAGDPLQHLRYRFDPTDNITAIDDLRSIAPGLPENATQSFAYDGLNRLTRAEGPGYGAIDFQYDAIGNLIHKTSPPEGDPRHVDDPLINLQTLSYGGAAGSNNRVGRLPGDEPGPHAVTATESGLAYAYDDNGNVTERGPDRYEWDFNDRLVRAVTPQSDTRYVYNTAGQRVVKKVTQDGQTRTTWYVSDGYEVRDGVTEKYVFAGSRRVARLTGRLTVPGEPLARVFALRPGMNFVGLEFSVPVGDVLAALGEEAQVWCWDADSRQYLGVVPAEDRHDFETLEPGRGYIVYSDEARTLSLSGTRALADLHLGTGWNLVGCPADRELSMADVVSVLGTGLRSVWAFDAEEGEWRTFLAEGPAFLNTLAAMVPGGAYWVELGGPADLPVTHTPVAVHFYHPDHLGSASLVTDVAGAVAERVEYYPYGRPRYEQRSGFESPYTYTDKELDGETGLMYFEARYYDPVVGRFVSVDPLVSSTARQGRDDWLAPAYRYCRNNPFVYLDKNGKEEEVVEENQNNRRNPEVEWAEGRKLALGAEIAGIGIYGSRSKSAVLDERYTEFAVPTGKTKEKTEVTVGAVSVEHEEIKQDGKTVEEAKKVCLSVACYGYKVDPSTQEVVEEDYSIDLSASLGLFSFGANLGLEKTYAETKGGQKVETEVEVVGFVPVPTRQRLGLGFSPVRSTQRAVKVTVDDTNRKKADDISWRKWRQY